MHESPRRPGPRPLLVMRGLAVLDAALVAVLAYGVLQQRWETVLVVAPTRVLVYLMLMVNVFWGARRWWWGWDVVLWCAVLGPLATVPALFGARPVER